MATFRYRHNPGAIERILRKDPRAEALVHKKASDIVDEAKKVFLAQQNPDNEHRTSEFTPPKYISSFGVDHGPGLTHYAYNDDPGWHLVEWGAHPGGNPDVFVLRYKPLTRGLLIVSARHNTTGRQ